MPLQQAKFLAEDILGLVPSRFFWALVVVSSLTITALAVATTVQWCQAQALDAAARLKKDSMTALINN